ncbi:MAG: OmpA family protein [Acidithiobacillus sp.]
MQKFSYNLVALAVGSMALTACAPVHYHSCNLSCFAKPKPVKVQPAPPPPPPPVKKIAPVEQTILQSTPITIRGVNFNTGSAKIMGSDVYVLDRAARFAQKHPSAVLLVKGYCSHTGSYGYNLKLSKQRANAVAGYLTQQGVPGYRIITRGYSWMNPIASNATREGRFLNQRVVIESTIQVKKIIR